MVFFRAKPAKKRANAVKTREKRRALPADVIRASVFDARPFSCLKINLASDCRSRQFTHTDPRIFRSIRLPGIDDLSALKREDKEKVDPAVENVVHFLLCELEEEGKITCYCKEEGEIPLYDFQILSERVRVFCHCCNAEAYLPLRSEADAEDFIKTDRLDLK